MLHSYISQSPTFLYYLSIPISGYNLPLQKLLLNTVKRYSISLVYCVTVVYDPTCQILCDSLFYNCPIFPFYVTCSSGSFSKLTTSN